MYCLLLGDLALAKRPSRVEIVSPARFAPTYPVRPRASILAIVRLRAPTSVIGESVRQVSSSEIKRLRRCIQLDTSDKLRPL